MKWIENFNLSKEISNKILKNKSNKLDTWYKWGTHKGKIE